MAKGKPKQKTRKVAVKRFKITKTGKVKRKHAATSHLGRKNDSSSKSRKKNEFELKTKHSKKIKSMIVNK